MSKYEQCVLTGCDAKSEWQLEWFMDNYRKQNSSIPIVLCDFGMNPQTLNRIKYLFSGIMDLTQSNQKGLRPTLDEIEIESQIHRRKADDEHAEADRHQTRA